MEKIMGMTTVMRGEWTTAKNMTTKLAEGERGRKKVYCTTLAPSTQSTFQGLSRKCLPRHFWPIPNPISNNSNSMKDRRSEGDRYAFAEWILVVDVL